MILNGLSGFFEIFLPHKFAKLLASPVGVFCIIISLGLIVFSVAAFLSAPKGKQQGQMLSGTGMMLAVFGFLFLSRMIAISLPDKIMKVLVITILGVGNAVLWVQIIQSLADTPNKKEARNLWFPLSIFPVVSLWVIVGAINS